MNYGELKTLVAGYLHRTDLTANIPDFIELARGRINRDLRVREMLTLATTTPVANPFDVESDFLEMRDIYHSSNGQRLTLSLVGRRQLNLYRSTSLSQTVPRFYSIDGTQIETAPGGIGVEFTELYYASQAAFTSDSDERTTLTTYPSIWLYGALIEAHTFTQDMDLVEHATSNYTSEVKVANMASKAAESGASLQMQGASQWH